MGKAGGSRPASAGGEAVVQDTMQAALVGRSLSGELDWLTIGSLLQRHGRTAADARGQFQRSGLHIAVSENKTEYIRLLVARGASLSAKCGLGLTPLQLGVVRGHLACVEVLLALGAGMEEEEEISTALWIGRYMGHADIVSRLVHYREKRLQVKGQWSWY